MSGCWLWHASQTSAGYGNLNYQGEYLYAHRCSFDAANGEGASEGIVVRHRCDNPCCINPVHLIGGTQADNSEDAWRRGRMNPIHGEQHPRSVLTEQIVLQARKMAAEGVSLHEIADLLGFRRNAISAAVTGETWKYLPGALGLPAIAKKTPTPRPLRGSRHPNSILGEDEARQIINKLAKGSRGVDLAKEFNISVSTVSAINKGRLWSHLR